MDLMPLLLSLPVVLAWQGFAVRILTMGMVCAVLIWLKNRHG